MECTCIRHTELPGTTRLFADLVYHPDRTSPFYSSPQTIPEAASQIDFPAPRRAALVSALREINGPSQQLDLLSQPGTVAILTGQQVGLFSGPAYTLYKALTAVKLARELTAGGLPAVPVFWLATEDHDFAEVDHAWVFNRDFQPIKTSLPFAAEPNRPVGPIALTDVPLSELQGALAGLPFAEETFRQVAAAYQPGVSLGAAFATLLKEILGPYQVLFIDPMNPAVRALAAPIMAEALAAAPELAQDLLARKRDLEKAGYHAQVHVDESTSLFFLLEDGKRLALRRNREEYIHQGRHFPVSELLARVEHISPNALLRPVIQDYMLPTVAYIGGPAELAYLAQSQVIYNRLLGRQPLPLSRAGFTLFDHHSSKLMARYQLSLPDFFGGEAALREKVAARLAPAHLTAVMADTRAGAARALDTLKATLTAFDPTLAKALNRSRRKIDYQLSKIEAKTSRQILLRDSRATHDSTALANFIYPHKHLQERFYSIVPFLAKFGPALVDSVYENIHLDCADHKLLTV